MHTTAASTLRAFTYLFIRSKQSANNWRQMWRCGTMVSAKRVTTVPKKSVFTAIFSQIIVPIYFQILLVSNRKWHPNLVNHWAVWFMKLIQHLHYMREVKSVISSWCCMETRAYVIIIQMLKMPKQFRLSLFRVVQVHKEWQAHSYMSN